ncbi:MAG TPA: hypothetical protein VNW29_04285 [Candidatus Sulfotelmatobacter sp.]|nr:hypothetical protein [Candidatus Sulfotelmatobacter sp.]
MNEEIKTLLLKLDSELQEMYDCFIEDETNLALFHLGAMRSLVTWQLEKNGINVKNIQNSDQNGERKQLNGALVKEAQTTQTPTIVSTSGTVTLPSLGKQYSLQSDALSDSSASVGRRQSTGILQMDS